MSFAFQLAGSSTEQLSGGSTARQHAFYDRIYPSGWHCRAEIINQPQYCPEQTGNVEKFPPKFLNRELALYITESSPDLVDWNHEQEVHYRYRKHLHYEVNFLIWTPDFPGEANIGLC